MKKLLLLLLLIPNLVMAKSFICIAENSAGIKQNYGKDNFTSTTFKATNKFIVKKINNEWKVKNFEDSDDSIYTQMAKCKEYKRELKEDEDVNFLSCTTFGGTFDIHFDNLRFVTTRIGDWSLGDEALMGDGVIESGSCSSI